MFKAGRQSVLSAHVTPPIPLQAGVPALAVLPSVAVWWGLRLSSPNPTSDPTIHLQLQLPTSRGRTGAIAGWPQCRITPTANGGLVPNSVPFFKSNLPLLSLPEAPILIFRETIFSFHTYNVLVSHQPSNHDKYHIWRQTDLGQTQLALLWWARVPKEGSMLVTLARQVSKRKLIKRTCAPQE